ncbi:MAG: hypothetical protein LBB36_04530 [Fibromonadaceae bacterium]|jgi:uncharacterized protein (TIGR02145 family)|nr:hypothetical protein [Fibromonadaceae bacterium]
MKPCPKILLAALFTALLLSCSEEFECVHCREDFFENAAPSSSSEEISSSSFEVSSSSETRFDCGGDEYNPEEQLCDERDGNLYEFTEIGNQTWMAENLKYSKDEKFDFLPVPPYGILYGKAQITFGDLCPQGWRLPILNDFNNLLNLLTRNDKDVNELKAMDWDTGTDAYGFTALPGGFWDGEKFEGRGSVGSWYYINNSTFEIFQIQDDFAFEEIKDENEMHSIRCIKEQ